jgi:uncharacterized protein YbjT (DUF2867 family)
MSYNRKPLPQNILVFGAAAHIGGPLAKFLVREAPSIRLRLATHSPEKVEGLRAAFPDAEVVQADYADLPSLRKAVDGMEGVFVIAPGNTDEQMAMTNLAEALKASGSLIQLIRQLGIQPEANLRRIPKTLRRQGGDFFPFQHPIAKRILDEAGLPVTYLNCGATFMDNFLVLGMHRILREHRRLIWPERLIPWIDPRDIGEVAGRLFLSDNHRHIGQFHTLNNGHDLMRFHDVAELMSEIWEVPIAYDGSKESFFSAYPFLGPMREFVWEFLAYEQENEVVWARNDFVERTLERKPTTLRQWLIEHRDAVLGATQR